MTDGIYKSDEGKKVLLDFYDRMLARWPVSLIETDISTNSGNTHVLVSGNPENLPLVLLHGSTSNAVTWLSDAKVYSRDFCVYIPDMPGEPGKSTEQRLSWKNDEYARWLLQVLDGLGLEKPSIVGLSLGGWAAMKFASCYPHRAGNLALIAPGGLVNPRMSTIFKLVKYQRQGEEGVSKTLKLLFPDNFDSPEVIEFFGLLEQHFNARTEPLPRLSDEEISAIESNVFMICGTKDAFFNFKKAAGRLLRLLPYAETHLVRKGTHGLVSVAEAVLPFLKKRKTPSG